MPELDVVAEQENEQQFADVLLLGVAIKFRSLATAWHGKGLGADKRARLQRSCRVRALLRRGATESPGILQIDDLVLNPATREVARGGQRIELTLKEYALLEYLMRHTGRVLTRPMISEHVWNQDFDTFTNVIDVYVNYLRNKIDRGRSKKLIHTIRGSGYMLKVD